MQKKLIIENGKLSAGCCTMSALAIFVIHKNYLEDFRQSFIECVLKRFGETITEKDDPFALVDLTEFNKSLF